MLYHHLSLHYPPQPVIQSKGKQIAIHASVKAARAPACMSRAHPISGPDTGDGEGDARRRR